MPKDSFKYALVVPGEFMWHFKESQFEVTGLLCWVEVFQKYQKLPAICTITDDLSEYDVIHFNISSTELHYPYIARMQNPDATLIANLDFGISSWQQYLITMDDVKDVMKFCNGLFSVEENQKKWLEMMLKRDVTLMPHPIDIKAIDEHTKDTRSKGYKFFENSITVATQWRQYDNNHILPIEFLKQFYKAKRVLFGVKTRKAKEMGVRLPGKTIPYSPAQGDIPRDLVDVMVPLDDGWDLIFPYMGPMDYYNFLCQSDIGLDLRTMYGSARYPIDCSLVGIPCVSTDFCKSGKYLFPELTFKMKDLKSMKLAMNRLIEDETFREKHVKKARKKLEYYGFEQCEERFRKLVEESS